MADDKISYHALEKHKIIVYILPCILAAVCYLNGLKGQFVHDDIFAIQNNPDVIGRNPLLELFTNDFWGMPMTDVKSHKSYRPFCVLTFRLDHYISGGNPAWFHVVNTTLHVLVTLTFTIVCLRTLQISLTCTLLASCLFAVHPIHTEAVTGLVGRAEVLAALFFLLSFYTFSRCVFTRQCMATDEVDPKCATRSGDTTTMWSSHMVHLGLSLLLSGVAMLCKEGGVTVLGVSLLFDMLHHWRIVFRDVTQRRISILGSLILVRCTCLVLAGVLLLLLRFWIMNFDQPHVFQEESNPASFSSSVLTRFLTFLYLPTFNFWLLLCPAKLSYDWTGRSIPLLDSFSDSRNLISFSFYMSVLILLVTCLRKAWQKNLMSTTDPKTIALLTSAGLMAFPFLPATNLFFKVGFVVAERVLYIPSMGYCLLVTHGFLGISAHLPQFKGRLLTLYLLMLLTLSLRTLDRNQVWLSRHSLFWSGVRDLPHNDKIHYNLANLLKDEGRMMDAEDHYRTAIQLNPNIASYHMNLGSLLSNKTEAHLCYQEALRLRPNHIGTMVNLGSLLLNQGDQSGMSLIKQVLTKDPNHIEAVITMAYALLARENMSEAGKYSRHAVKIRPDSSKAHLCHGIYLQNSGQTVTALHEYEEVLRLDPRETYALINSAKIYFSSGQLSEARVQLERALDVSQDCSECLSLLGSVYSRQGQGQQAVITLGQASALAPNNSHTNLKYVQALKENQQSGKAWSVLKDLILRVSRNTEVLKFAFTFAMEEKIYSEALHYIQEMINVAEQTSDSSLAALYKEQGDAYRYNNDTASALKSYEKAIQINTSFVEAIIDAGSIHFLQKNFALAESYYLQALKLDSINNLAKVNLDKVRRLNHRTRDG